MKIIRLIPVLCLVAFSACKGPMEKYYNDDKFTPPGEKPVMEVLKSNPQYSTFAYLMEQTGMDQLIKDNVLLTLWVPLNDDMPAEVLTLTKEEQIRMLKNHLSFTMINSSALKSQYRVAALSGRYMPTENRYGIFYVDGAELLNMDIACSNGMIHEISEWFLPRVTLYDYVSTLSGDYTIFRDSLLGRDIVSFDKDSSTTEHVDENGQPIWNPVYKTTNNIFDYAKLKDITQTYTVFIPSNEAIAGMYRDMSNYLLAANYPLTSQDSSRWMDWLMRTCIQTGQKEYRPNYEQEWINSLWVRNDTDEEKKKWEAQALYTFRTKFQEIYDPAPEKCLNGWAYNLDKIRVPKTMYVLRSEFNPWGGRNEVGGMNPQSRGFDWWTGNIQSNISGPKTSPANTVFIQFGRPGFAATDGTEPASYVYKSTGLVQVEAEGQTSDVLELLPVMPGYYDIGLRFHNYTVDNVPNATDSVFVKVNGIGFKVKGIVRGLYGNDTNFAIRDIYIPGQYEPVTVEIEMYPTSDVSSTYQAWRRLHVGLTRLVPTTAESNFM